MQAALNKRPSKIDHSYMSGLYHYAVTLTKQNGFAEADESWILRFHEKFERCYLVRELHDNGEVHYHSGIACSKPSTANAITKQLERVYKYQDWTWVTGVSVKVKKMSDFWGWMHYLDKECKGKPLYRHGWQLSWIQKGLEANVMKKPTRIIMKGRRAVKKHEAVDLIIDYSMAIATPITGKESYKTVIKKMTRKGFRFHNVRHEHSFQEVMCVNGDDSYLERGLENQLQFL